MSLPQENAQDERRKLYEERIEWLRSALEKLRQDRRRTKWLWLASLGAIPAWIMGGIYPVLLVLCLTVTLTVGLYYFIWNHTVECETELDALTRLLNSPPEGPTDQDLHRPPAPEQQVQSHAAVRRRRAGWL
jgi:hypothetical protein